MNARRHPTKAKRTKLLAKWVIAVAFGTACSRTKAQPDRASTMPMSSASASIVDASAPDASHADIELIWGEGLLVGVSSFVDNDLDLPEHIADHDASTAWNSKTGDLVGGWMGVRDGDKTYIHYAMLTVGFDKKTESEDLFTENYRITRVRVDCTPFESPHERRTLREVDVDPEVRTPQRIEVDAWCWDLKLVVTGVKPGTRTGWRELTVSELGLYGWEKPPDTPQIPYYRHPLFAVGTHYELPKRAAIYQGATYAEACAKLVADDQDQKPASCGEPVLQPGHGAFIEVAHVPYTNHSFRGELLGFRVASGAFITYQGVSGREGTDQYPVTYRVQSETCSGTLVVDVLKTEKPMLDVVEHNVCHAAKDAWCTVIPHVIEEE